MLTIATVNGEPAVVCWLSRDFEDALETAADMGQPTTTTSSVAVVVRFYPDMYVGSAEELDQLWL